MRVLVVEDEIAIGLMIEDMLIDLGHEVAGLATKLSAALDLAETVDAGAAILDINLNGSESFAAADVLRRRGIPFVFATGYGAHGLCERFAGVATLSKPFQSADLQAALIAMQSPGRALE